MDCNNFNLVPYLILAKVRSGLLVEIDYRSSTLVIHFKGDGLGLLVFTLGQVVAPLNPKLPSQGTIVLYPLTSSLTLQAKPNAYNYNNLHHPTLRVYTITRASTHKRSHLI